MPSDFIGQAVREAWVREIKKAGKTLLDLSTGSADTATMLASLGFSIVATEYSTLPFIGDNVARVVGVDLNHPLPFKASAVDGVNLTEVIEHIENQAQLIGESPGY